MKPKQCGRLWVKSLDVYTSLEVEKLVRNHAYCFDRSTFEAKRTFLAINDQRDKLGQVFGNHYDPAFIVEKNLDLFIFLLLFFLVPTFCFWLYLLMVRAGNCINIFSCCWQLLKMFIMAKNTIFIIVTICFNSVAVWYFLKALLCYLLKIVPLLQVKCNFHNVIDSLFAFAWFLFFHGVSMMRKMIWLTIFPTFGNYFVKSCFFMPPKEEV